MVWCETKASDYAFSATISSMHTWFVSVYMAGNNNDDDLHHRMKAHKQTSRAQQVAMDNIQRILMQLLTNWNNDKNTDSHYDEEEKCQQRASQD